MEIDFLVQLKKHISDKTTLISKFDQMFTVLFKDAKNNSFSFKLEDGSDYNLSYKYSEKKEKIYLKISTEYTEAKSAKLLSKIREKIIKGEHRKDFFIICTYDEASLSYCCRLMKTMGVFERHLRKLMYFITVQAFGVDWVEESFPKDILDKIKENNKGEITDTKLTETAFELLDYGDIISYLFSKRYINYTPEDLLENKLSDKSLSKLSKEEIISIISRNRKESLWNKLFYQNSAIKEINEDTIKQIKTYRNDVMHHHTLTEDLFIKIRSVVKKADKCIMQAINEIENKIYTEEEYISVFSTIGLAIPELLKTLKVATKIEIPDFSNSIGIALKNLSEITKGINVKVYNSIMQNYKNIASGLSLAIRASAVNIPNYSKLANIYINSPELIDYSPLKNILSDNDNKKTEIKDDNISNEKNSEVNIQK